MQGKIRDNGGIFQRMEAKDVLTTTQVAEWLQVAESTIRKWVHYRFIPYVKLGRCVRFRGEEIEKWLDERAEAGRATLVPEIQCQ
jgi:excisionase family DNA binding protein